MSIIFRAMRGAAPVMAFLLMLAAAAACASCSDGDDFTTSPSARLTFPADTLDLDTVVSTMPTRTYAFTVRNRTHNGIRITRVELGRGSASEFKVNVDGTFVNEPYDYPIEVRGRDSISVRVQMTPRFHDSDAPVLVSDRLLFTLESGVVQQIVLNAYSQDVNELDATTITTDTTLAAARPFLINNSLHVAEGVTLTVAPGTTLMFTPKSELIVDGTLLARGSADEPIIFRGARLDYMFAGQPYDRIPGQWGGVRFTSSSYDNALDYCDIHSGSYGVICDSSGIDRRKLTMENSVVHNVLDHCLMAVNSDVFVGNSQITNARGNSVMLCGGSNHFVHCTIANFFPFTGSRGKALYLYNYVGTQSLALHEALFENCVLLGWGADEVGLGFLDEPGLAQNYRFRSCLVATKTTDDADHYAQCVFDTPENQDVFGSKNFISFDNKTLIYYFRPDTLSRARAIADTAITRRYYPRDRHGIDRLTDGKSDAGCYEFE